MVQPLLAGGQLVNLRWLVGHISISSRWLGSSKSETKSRWRRFWRRWWQNTGNNWETSWAHLDSVMAKWMASVAQITAVEQDVQQRMMHRQLEMTPSTRDKADLTKENWTREQVKSSTLCIAGSRKMFLLISIRGSKVRIIALGKNTSASVLIHYVLSVILMDKTRCLDSFCYFSLQTRVQRAAMVSLAQMMQPLMAMKIRLDRSKAKSTPRRSNGKRTTLVRNHWALGIIMVPLHESQRKGSVI